MSDISVSAAFMSGTTLRDLYIDVHGHIEQRRPVQGQLRLLIMPSLNRPDVPKHVQLAQILRGQIDDGTYQASNPIPSEPRLAEEYEINRATVRKAIETLISEGRLYRVRGLGTFVGAPPYADPTPWPSPPGR